MSRRVERVIDRDRWWVVLPAIGLVLAVVFAAVALGVRAGRPEAMSPGDIDRLKAAGAAASASNAAAAAAAVPKPAIFLGDSYAAGTGASEPTRRWSSIVAGTQNWTEENHAFGSTGYVTATTGSTAQTGCGENACPNYEQALASTTTAEPAVVLVSGGRNDVGSVGGSFAVSVGTFFRDVRAKFPNATILATSPLWDDDVAPAGLAQIATAVRDGVGAVGGTYLDIGQPLQGHPELISDGVHPNDAGYQAIAAAVDEALAAAGVQG